MENIYERQVYGRIYYIKEVNRGFNETTSKVVSPTNPAMDTIVLGEAISEILEMSRNTIFEVKITISKNIYRDNPELNYILKFVPESRFQRKQINEPKKI